MVIKKIMMLKGNRILQHHNEVRERTKLWVAMAYIVKVCKIIDH